MRVAVKLPEVNAVTTPSKLPEGWSDVSLDGGGNPAFRAMRALGRDRLNAFLAASLDPAAAQARALRAVLSAVAGTPYAREFGLAGVHTLADFRAAVPIRSFGGHADDLDAIAAGDLHRRTGAAPTSFVRTSGTSGRPKLLPVTRDWADTVAEGQWLWVLAMVAEQAEQATGRVLTGVGSAVEGTTPSGLGYGSNTGRMAQNQPWWVRARYAVPPEVHDIADPELRRYVLLRIALGVDVRSWTTANPTSILASCRAIERWHEALAADLADGTLRNGPASSLTRRERIHYWPHLHKRRVADLHPARVWDLASVNCWTGGSAKWFLDQLPAALGGAVKLREAGISASEGYFAFPLHSSWRGGVAFANGHLLELLPVDGGEVRGLADAELGREYRLVISTTAGLLRYDLEDIVRVVGFWRRLPLWVFVGRAGEASSLTGEKLTGEQIADALKTVLHGRECAGMVVVPRLGEVPGYTLRTEGVDIDPQRFDVALCTLNVEYAGKRHDGRLGEWRCERLPEGTLARWRAGRFAAGAAEGQVKDPLFVTAVWPNAS